MPLGSSVKHCSAKAYQRGRNSPSLPSWAPVGLDISHRHLAAGMLVLLSFRSRGCLRLSPYCGHNPRSSPVCRLGTTASGVANLLRLTGCNCILAHVEQRDLAEAAAQHPDLRQDVQLFDWLSYGDAAEENAIVTPLYPAGPDDVIVIFHSSGSSGNPKVGDFFSHI